MVYNSAFCAQPTIGPAPCVYCYREYVIRHYLTLTTLKYVCINHEDQRVFGYLKSL